jgi:hypothetical protein
MRDANYANRVSGRHYIDLLADIHDKLKPSTYFEIGVQADKSLELATCPTVAVDPVFIFDKKAIFTKPSCCMYQKTSDDFFANHSPSNILGSKIDLAFLDGMHWFEFLLRDFINTEKHCGQNSTIILHDCLPPGFYMTSRDINDSAHPLSAFQGWWAGDVWKIVPTLQKYRPDLKVTVTDCVPTGLVIITNLDPKNETLAVNYDQIVGSFKELDRDEFENYWGDVKITPASNISLTEMY